jgi:hypothetical protein
MSYSKLALTFSILVTGFAFTANHTRAEDRSDWFSFVVPTLANERTAGTPIDLSWLSPEPAGAGGRLRADGERIVDARGREVRLFGTNICDWHAIMPREYAEPVARRLRELGINFIRLHYFDFKPAPEGILQADMQSLDPAMLDRLHYLVAQLKAHGIYVDINLHVARSYPGQPAGWQWMGKGIDRIHRPYLESQKTYARDLLTAINPHTGLSLAEDPAVAIIELNNENTALATWTGVEIGDYARMDATFSAPLRAAWNSWLRTRYQTTDGLRLAWAGPVTEPQNPTELLESVTSNAWSLEASFGGVANLKEQTENGTPHLHWAISSPGTAAWAHQLHHGDLKIEPGQRSHTLRIEARSPSLAAIEAKLMRDRDPWDPLTATIKIPLTPEWSEVEVTLIGGKDEPDALKNLRLTLSTDNKAGTVEIRRMSLRAGRPALPANIVDLDSDAVPLVETALRERQMQDYLEFLADTEIAHSRELRDYLRNELGVKTLILDSQASYGGLHGLRREAAVSDVIDMHSYPAHPRETGRTAEGVISWAINNYSLTTSNAPAYSSAWRLANRPFGVTEFDLNPPNDHAVESYPFFALAAAYQGWAFTGEYSWLNFQKEYNPQRIHSHFASTGHAGQMASIPSSALLYRLGLVRPATTRATLRLPVESIASLHGATAFRFTEDILNRELGANPSAWRQGLAVELVPGDGAPVIEGFQAYTAEEAKVFQSDTGEIQVDQSTKKREKLTVIAPAYRQLTGFVGGTSQTLGDITLEVAAGTRNNYAHMSLVALDGKPIAESKRLLFTVLARIENAGMVYSEDRTSIGADYGHGPTLAEPVQVTLRLPNGSWRASPLAGDGTVVGGRPLPDSILKTRPSDGSVWYLLTRD